MSTKRPAYERLVVHHEPLSPASLTTPVTVTLDGYAAEELRRVARRGNGPVTDATLTALVRAAINRGLPLVEQTMESTTLAHVYGPSRGTRRRSKSTADTDNTEENETP